MKKILFVIDTLRMGGAEKSLVSLLNAIDKEKYDIDVLVFEEGGILQKELPENIRLIHADSKTRAMTLEFRKYSRDLLKKGALGAYIARIRMTLNAKKGKKSFNWNLIKKHIPVFEGSYDAAISYLEGFPAFYVIDKVKAEKKIAWIHIDTTKYNMSSDERKYYAKFDQIVTISEICKSAFIDHVPEIAEKINVIENIVDPQEVLAKADEQVDYSTWRENAVNLVTVGRLDYQKGLDMAIEACGQLVKYGVDVNARDNNGLTPLMYATYNKEKPEMMINVLLKNGANPQLTDNKGHNASDYISNCLNLSSEQKVLLALKCAKNSMI